MSQRIASVSLFIGIVACGGGVPPGPDCRVGADCASGVCTREGRCGVAPVDDAGATAGGAAGGSSAGGAMGGGTAGTGGGSAGGSAAGGTAGGSNACLTNHDGTITRAEVVTGPGLRATFRVSTEATFNTAGIALPDGGSTWDFTGALAGDQSLLVETQPIAGKWFESNYLNASYVVPLGQGTDLLGVFSSTPDGLYLLGAASPASGATATRLNYTPPVKLLQFPLTLGTSWTSASAVSGVAPITPGTIALAISGTTDTYTSTVDRAGDAVVPYSSGLSLPVLRVRTTMSRTVFQIANTSFRQFQYVTECFGTIATVRSLDREANTEFTAAKEVRRLAP
jgi:hypothetical protein